MSFRYFVAAVLSALALGSQPVFADTYVAKGGDYEPANPGNGTMVTWNGETGGPVENLVFGSDAFTSIQEAINAASSGATVYIADGTYDEGTDIIIDKSLTFQGDGLATIITGGEAHRVFDIGEGRFDVAFDGLTITNGQTSGGHNFEVSGAGIRSASTGSVTVANSILSHNSTLNMRILGGGSGGAISASGSLKVINSTVSSNAADANGAGISASASLVVANSNFTDNFSEFGDGGGISASGSTTVTGSTFMHNGSQAGGAMVALGSVAVDNCVFSHNNGLHAGGGIYNFDGSVTVTNSTFLNNYAHDSGGGGIFNFEGSVTATNCTFSENSTGGEAFGGAIHNSNGTITVANSTLAGNSSAFTIGFNGKGGGIYNETGTMTVANSTLTGNVTGSAGSGGGIHNAAGTVTVNNSIVAGNLGVNADVAGGGTFISNGANFIGIDDSTGTTFTAAGDKTFANTAATVISDVILPLSDNGGSTMTHALAAGSPAANMGKNADIPADSTDADGDADITEPMPYDQRGAGFPRVVGTFVDIGAFESTELATPNLTLTIQDTVYDGAAYAGATTSITGGTGDVSSPAVVLEYFSTNDAIPANAIASPINAGTYWIRAFFGGNEGNNPVTTALQSFQITTVALAAFGTTADKTYDATAAATIVVSLNGVINGDVVSGSASGTFSDKNVGADKTVTVGTVILTGADSANYTAGTVSTATATITAAELTASGSVVDKVYDGTTEATVAISLSGILSDDIVTATATGVFSDKNAGIGKSVTIGTVTLAGGDASNYTVASPGTTTATITAASLSVVAIAASKTIGDTDPAFAFNADGFVAAETAAIALTGTLTRQPGESVGSYDIEEGSLAAVNGNYDIAFTGAIFEILAIVPTPHTLAIRATTDGFLLSFRGTPGGLYIFQHTDNPVGPWQTLIGPLTASPTGALEHEDKPVPLPRSRYYRAVSAP